MKTRDRSTDLLTLLIPLVLAALSGSMACGNAGAPGPITSVVGQLRSIDYANLPHQEAINFVSFLVLLQDGRARFGRGVPTVGGRTHIGIIT